MPLVNTLRAPSYKFVYQILEARNDDLALMSLLGYSALVRISVDAGRNYEHIIRSNTALLGIREGRRIFQNTLQVFVNFKNKMCEAVVAFNRHTCALILQNSLATLFKAKQDVRFSRWSTSPSRFNERLSTLFGK